MTQSRSNIVKLSQIMLSVLMIVTACGCHRTRGINPLINFDGIINQSTVQKFMLLDTALYGTVNVSSPGGDALQALVLAEFLNKSEKKLEVTGICASACITLFLATDRAEIGENALFLSHSSPISRARMIEGALSQLPQESEIELDDSVLQISNYIMVYQAYATKLNDGIPDETTAVTGPLCSGVVNDGRVYMSLEGKRAFHSQYDFWVPETVTLKRWRMGREFSDQYKYNESLSRRLLANYDFVRQYHLRPRILDAEVLRARNWFREIAVFSFCS